MYHCLRPEAVPFQACYGDILYVDAVLKYYQPGAVSTGGGKNPGSGGSSGVKVVDVGRPLIGKVLMFSVEDESKVRLIEIYLIAQVLYIGHLNK